MAIFDELKSVAKVLQEAGKIEQYQQILEVQEKLLEMQKRIFELEENNRNLKEELQTKRTLKHKGEVYYSVDESGEDGPFCALCYDTKKFLVRMIYWNDNSKKCPNCEKIYQIK